MVNEFHQMSVLITGGFGFVGGRLGKHLVHAGYQVMLSSRCETNSPEWLPQAEVTKILWQDDSSLERMCNGADMVIHASGLNAQDCSENPLSALEINGMYTIRLLTAAKKAGVKRFIYLSTAHVYSDPLIGILNEETCPRNMHPYATGHLAGEYAVIEAGQRNEIESLVLRLSNVFGSPAYKGVNCWMLTVNDLCRQVIQKKEMLLRTDGHQERDFIPMTDVCYVIEQLLRHASFSSLHAILNVGSGKSYSVLEMAQKIQARCKFLFDFKPNIQRGKSCSNQNKLKYCIDRLKEAGITSDVDMDSEIDNLLQFCFNNFGCDESINGEQ